MSRKEPEVGEQFFLIRFSYVVLIYIFISHYSDILSRTSSCIVLSEFERLQ